MKIIKKTGILILLSLSCAIFLTACGTSIVSEKEITESIVVEDYILSNYDLEVTDFEITKRQTNQDDKEDFIWCSLVAENDYFTYEYEYELEYVLYNDGWILENSNTNYNLKSYTLKQDVTMVDEDTIINDIKNEDDFFDIYGLEVTSVEIYDADLSAEMDWSSESAGCWEEISYWDGIYKCYTIDVEAENDDFIYYNSYTITYIYDYDRWEFYLIDGVSSSDYKVLILDEINQSESDDIALMLSYDNIEFISRAENDKYVTFQYMATKTEYYLTSEYTVNISYYYNLDDGFSQKTSETLIDEYPDVIGEWLYQDDDRNFYINIVDIDIDERWVELEFSIEGLENHKYTNIYSDGALTKELGQYLGADTKWSALYVEDSWSAYIWIYLGNEGAGFTIEGYLLTKIS